MTSCKVCLVVAHSVPSVDRRDPVRTKIYAARSIVLCHYLISATFPSLVSLTVTSRYR